MRPADFDFDLPPGQIAQHPATVRGAARMLVLEGSAMTHSRASSLPTHLPADALVVVNDSRVVPARLHVTCTEGKARGRRLELLVCDPRPGAGPGAQIRAWVRGARRLAEGDVLTVGELALRHLGRPEDADRDPRARLFEVTGGELLPALEAAGEVPLPPYIERPADEDDRDRYQTVYARAPGSVAAPTAGLHWDAALLASLDTVAITLHVGPGTFLPMEVDDITAHKIAPERVEIDEAAAARIRDAQARGRPIVAVGTTATRALEAVAKARGEVTPYDGPVDLVIRPGHRFRVVDRLVTNFHLPRSSLLMLVCSFGGRERVLAGYREAVTAGYRFYSYGDCMLVDRASDR